MKLYKISQTLTMDYDEYDSAIVSAKSPEEARTIHPNGSNILVDGVWRNKKTGESATMLYYLNAWVMPDEINTIKVEYIGETKKRKGVILASYNAG